MFLVKWLVIPVGLAALGFFVIGPLLGRQAAPPPSVKAPAEPITEEPAANKVTGNPDVEVSARPATRRRSSRSSNRRRTEPPRTVPDIPSPDEEPPRTGPDGG
jgi:hypothetical protein